MGSTTKVILMRKEDCAILASEYLRTNGDPIQASVECYKSLVSQLSVPVKIIGLGVTGSGRHISDFMLRVKELSTKFLHMQMRPFILIKMSIRYLRSAGGMQSTLTSLPSVPVTMQ